MVTIYTKPDCPLCEKAEQLLKNRFPKIPVEKINIELSPELSHEYHDKIPVFFLNGAEIGYWRLPIKKLENILAGLDNNFD